jgi:tetratricopeptide (TPR) repeat protein
MKPRRWIWVLALTAALAAGPGARAAEPSDDDRNLRSGGRLIAAGWDQYEAGHYEKAAELFRLGAQASDAELANRARLGLGYALTRLDRADQAEAVFRDLWTEGFAPSQTGPALIGRLLARGRVEEAEKMLADLPAGIRDPWAAEVAEAKKLEREREIGRGVEEAWAALKADRHRQAAGLFEAARDRAEGDLKREAEMGLAYAYWRQGKLDRARRLFQELVDRDYRLDQTRPALIRVWLNLDQLERARREAAQLPPEQKKVLADELAEAEARLRAMRVARLHEKLSETDDPAAQAKLARTILEIDPDDRGALTVLGWACRALEDWDCARRAFRRLYRRQPQLDALLGLAYTLTDQDRPEEALEAIEQHPGPLNDQVRSVQVDLYRAAGQKRFDRAEYAAAEALARDGLAIQPNDPDLLELLGWSLYHQDRTEDALEVLRNLFGQEPDTQPAPAATPPETGAGPSGSR